MKNVNTDVHFEGADFVAIRIKQMTVPAQPVPVVRAAVCCGPRRPHIENSVPCVIAVDIPIAKATVRRIHDCSMNGIAIEPANKIPKPPTIHDLSDNGSPNATERARNRTFGHTCQTYVR